MSDHDRTQGIPGVPWAKAGEALVTGGDAELALLAGVTPATDKVPYFTSSSAASTFTATSFGRALMAKTAAVAVTGARDETEGAMVSLLAALVSLGLITNSTTAS